MSADNGPPLGSHLGRRHAVTCLSIAGSLPGWAPLGRPLGHPEVGLLGARRRNFKVFSFTLSPTELAAIDALARGIRGGLAQN
jgi:hypothetical protein